ncbi:uncharacterized protein ANIA_11315 [Aspergillus nidulans FGSC A4]|uniref:Uncharacterized protein n=1 Tax=Emericella nidulans (strain FGSC A4 / ATCC 38163 / CBS 112.46 / NRRL 194 / M139) TaxID=227321 RepID=C8VPE6_EMENI|nr:hypothetical protein [Aspergillus nidulans FGSC A4]CBF85562.1 TPA: hypothetical protein ANIA_11315 [Aspergillus nidulans FGSC A4]
MGQHGHRQSSISAYGSVSEGSIDILETYINRVDCDFEVPKTL